VNWNEILFQKPKIINHRLFKKIFRQTSYIILPVKKENQGREIFPNFQGFCSVFVRVFTPVLPIQIPAGYLEKESRQIYKLSQREKCSLT